MTVEGPAAAYDVELRPKGGGAARMGLTGDKNAFYGAAGATRATLPAAATDANSTQALVNAIRAALIGTGQTS